MARRRRIAGPRALFSWVLFVIAPRATVAPSVENGPTTSDDDRHALVMARIVQAQHRARAEASASYNRTLNLYTRTCHALYVDKHVPLHCERPLKGLDPGRSEWSREGRCIGEFDLSGQNEMRTDGLVAYATVHKAGSRAHTNLKREDAENVHRLDLYHLKRCSVLPVLRTLQHASNETKRQRTDVDARRRTPQPFRYAFTTVRNPIDRFVSAYNTVLSQTRGTTIRPVTAQRHTGAAQPLRTWRAPQEPTCHGRVELARVFINALADTRRGSDPDSILPTPDALRVARAQPVRLKDLRFDLHTGTISHDLGCSFAPSGEPIEQPPSEQPWPYLRLQVVNKLEQATRVKEVSVVKHEKASVVTLRELNARFLPGLWIRHAAGKGQFLRSSDGGKPGSLGCKLRREHLDARMIRTLCDFFAQDFVCFDYALPPECSSLAVQQV